jgi:hypothetical protein
MTLDPVAPVMTTLGLRRAQLRTHAAARSSPRASGPSALPQLTGWVNILKHCFYQIRARNGRIGRVLVGNEAAHQPLPDSFEVGDL